MKTFSFFILTNILLGFSMNSFGQDFASKRILTGNINLQLSTYNTNYGPNILPAQPDIKRSYLSLNTSFLSGRIKKNNTYAAYGFNLGIVKTVGENNGNNYTYNLGPIAQFGKFVKIVDQFYFAPNTRIATNIIWSKNTGSTTNGISLDATISPLSFVYKLNEKLLFNISMGSFGLNYTNTIIKTDFSKSKTNVLNLNGNISNQVGISAFYLFK